MSVLIEGTKIFKVLEAIWRSPSSVEELCGFLKEKNVSAGRKTASKYLRTLRAANFDIEKINGRFHLVSLPFEYGLNEDEIEGLKFIFEYLTRLLKEEIEPSDMTVLKNKITNLFNLGNFRFDDVSNECKNVPFLSFKGALNLKILNGFIDKEIRRLEVTFENKMYEIKAKEISFAKNGVFLLCKNETENGPYCFNVEKIDKIKPVKKAYFLEEITENEIVFKIKGAFMKNYILKRGEVAKYAEDEVIVRNKVENREELFNRLIKYGENCEVILPEIDRKAFIKKIKRLKEHYSAM